MDDSSTQESLELDVTNFGPIIQATVDLRPLTVFVGPSNTGKSYLAILIYALHQHFSGEGVRTGPRPLPQGPWRLRGVGSQELTSKKVMDALTQLAEQIVAANKRKSLLDEGIVLSASVSDFIRSVLEIGGSDLGNEISRCFGIGETKVLIRKGNRDGAGIVLRKSLPNEAVSVEHELTVGVRESEFKVTIPNGTPIRIDVGNTDRPVEQLCEWAMQTISGTDRTEEHSDFFAFLQLISLTDFVRPQVIAPLYCPAFYLPADRTGVMHAHSAVVSALIRGAATAGLRPAASLPLLSGVLADFLEQLIELDDPTDRNGPQRDLGRPIETALLGGSVRLERSEITGYPRFTYQPNGWKDDLPLMNASSMVSELAPVVLYLRHMVTLGDLLIVEEPESHLHPRMQVEFTRQLATLVRAGVRVLITTHSEWVLEELANIVQRSKLPEKLRKGDAEGAVALRPDQVGAWLFKKKLRPKGSVVEEIKLDEETGLYPTDYDAVSEALYNESVNIFNRIQGSKAE